MKRFLAFLLLLSHMNTSMFLPQIAEEDLYDANGQQQDDITSVVEYVRVALGYDKTADDENDDNGQNFHLVKAVNYNFQRQLIVIEKNYFAEIKRNIFSDYKISVPLSPTYDILTPPPNMA